MEYRNLGNSGLKVSAFGLGSYITYGMQVTDEDKIFECFNTAFNAGVNLFDTAESYLGAETALGKVFKRSGWRRCEYVVCAKLFFGDESGNRGPNAYGLSRKHITEGLNASLKRLQLDYVDILICHRYDESFPIEEIVRTMNHLIAQGKIFYWGTSEWDAEAIQEAIGVSQRLGLIGPITEQPQYSLLHRRRVEQEYAPICKKHGLGLMTFSPLTSGLLSGKYRDGNVPESRFDISGMWTQYEAGEGVQTLEIPDSKSIGERLVKIQAVADDAGLKMSQLSLAWILKNQHVDSVLLGASKVEQLVENLGALQILDRMTPEIMKKLEDAASNAPKPATPHLSYAKMMQESLIAANQPQSAQ